MCKGIEGNTFPVPSYAPLLEFRVMQSLAFVNMVSISQVQFIIKQRRESYASRAYQEFNYFDIYLHFISILR